MRQRSRLLFLVLLRMNVYALLTKTPLPEGVKIKLHSFFLNREYARDLKAIKKAGGTAQDLWNEGDWQFNFHEIEDRETAFHSDQTMRAARRHRIPVPQIYLSDGKLNTDFERSEISGRYFLTVEGAHRLRLAVREEEKYCSDRRARRIPYITAVAGLVGTISGLVALLKK